jgi:PTH1 family peptidyl-tRNA hydrolase
MSEDVLVIHDDIDLAFGRLKIKEKGGDGGHKGVKSIIDAFGRNDFPRLRIGIGRSENQTGVTEHVLGKFDSRELPMVNRTIGRSAEAVGLILCHGTKEGMNRFNSRKMAFYS